MVSDPRTVCGRGAGRAAAAPGEEGARGCAARGALPPPRAGAARARAAWSKGWGCPALGWGAACRAAGGDCKQDRERGL